jgi:predicted MFS family arabinose efflux permease
MVNLLDFGSQAGQIANQTRIFGLGDHMRGRLNTVYMAGTFSGGALGSLGGGLMMSHAGWTGVCLFAMAQIACAMLFLGVSMWKKRRAA